MLTAFVDESARHRLDESTSVYALAAVIVDDRGLAAVAEAMDGLRYRKNAQVHWRLERTERRPRIIEELASLPFSGVVTVCLHRTGVRQERARRFCLDALLTELTNRAVDKVIMESRNAALDDRDRAVLTALRRGGAIRPAMDVRWALPTEYPPLWAADCVVGVATGWLAGEDRFWRRIEHRVEVLGVDMP